MPHPLICPLGVEDDGGFRKVCFVVADSLRSLLVLRIPVGCLRSLPGFRVADSLRSLLVLPVTKSSRGRTELIMTR